MPPPTMPSGMDLSQAPFAGGGAPSMAQTAVPTQSGPGITWTAPEGWTAMPERAMRKATYAASGTGGAADISITAFPSDVGGELANLNRWRSQVKLPPLSAEEAEKTLRRLQVGSLAVTVADVAGPGGTDIIGAIVPYGGGTWFFKIEGPHATVEAQKEAFNRFRLSLKAP